MAMEGPVQKEVLSKEKNTQPAFIRNFSKESAKEERDLIARTIRIERQGHFEKKSEQATVLEELKSLSAKMETYNEASYLGKIKDYFKIRAVRESLGIAEVKSKEFDAVPTRQELNQSGNNAIADFYGRERKRWAETSFDKEDIKREFSEEHLASLDIEDYTLLMKRFPSQMVTHVTRQGVRDHTGMTYHTGGVDEFHSGFTDMLHDKRLKSAMALRLSDGMKDEQLLDAVTPTTMSGRHPPKSREEALGYLKQRLDTFSDFASVHFAAEEVADRYYGAEKGNEIFVAYPSAHISSKFYSSNTDASNPRLGDTMNNDVYVFDQEEKGMNIDAAITFIPKNARVGTLTGSRYEIDAQNRPIENTAGFEGLEKFGKSPELAAVAADIQKHLGELNARESLPDASTWDSEVKNESWDAFRRKDILEALIPIRDLFKKISGIDDDRILARVFSYSNIRDLANVEDRGNRAVDTILNEAGAKFVEARETISSKEYWEKYFKEHPEKEPSKIVYYEGVDPTRALFNWQKENGLNKKSTDENMGFSEHRLENTPEASLDNASRFEALVLKAIDNRFPEPAATNSLVKEPSRMTE